MGLGKYLKKRKFDKTPEPKGGQAKGGKLKFVVQQHHARAMHYDFRLEMDGVLKSWAVPKGPSMDPHQHHLAIQTEDHPYDYRTFEGVIPEGNYGAGNVIVWDEGWYEPRDPQGDQQSLLRDLKKGHVTFVMHGQKLQGEFALIKMPNAKEDDAWLLVKKTDEFATASDITKEDTSVKSHKHVDDLGAHNKLPDLSSYPKVAKPWAVKPMLSTLVDEPVNGDDWLFEIKWDGYRAIGAKKGQDIQLYSRNSLDFAVKYPPVVEALKTIDHDVILDGEIVVMDNDGKPHFEWMQDYGQHNEGNLRYCVFDILWCDGHDVRTMPLLQRKALLKSVLPKNSTLQYSDHVEKDGDKLFAQMQKQGLEGMIAKRADSLYREGVRGGDWLKIKTHQRQEVVIGGYTEPRGGRKYLGSLLIGVYEKGELKYIGHSGGGIPDKDREALQKKLARLERKNSPFSTTPKPNSPVHWVKPELVCEMAFAEWTSDGSMRHPSFQGLRPDKKPTDVHREKPKSAKSPSVKGQTLRKDGAGGLLFEATHLDKIFFPTAKYTKGDLFTYYESVAPYILPALKDRPMSMNRMPNGIGGESFYQKNNPHLPEWVPSADIFSESNNENLHWIVGGDLPTLLYMVQLGCIEINPWNSRVGHLDNPDWAVMDLDPEGVGFGTVIEVAQMVHKVCEEWHIPTYPKTSGKTGIHIYIPLGAKYKDEQAKNLAHLIALEVNQRLPKITSVLRMPDKRKRKVYLDFLQNRSGQTLAAPYSVRPTPQATVSMPLHWNEVTATLKPTDFTIKNTAARLKHTGDLWKPVLGKPIDLAKTISGM
jgi:bifunctional non-homologous end joining protein LigD